MAEAHGRGAARRRCGGGQAGWRGRQILDVVGDWAVRAPGRARRAAGRSSTTTRITPTWTTPPWWACCCTATATRRMPRRSRARARLDHRHAEQRRRLGRVRRREHALYLNHIPFADHGALLDPPTADVTARCVSFLAQIGMARGRSGDRARRWPICGASRRRTDRWFGRWGTNYIYGTWSVLCALNAAGVAARRPGDAPRRRLAAVATQREDGGWGEDEESYADAPPGAYHAKARRRRPPGRCWR